MRPVTFGFTLSTPSAYTLPSSILMLLQLSPIVIFELFDEIVTFFTLLPIFILEQRLPITMSVQFSPIVILSMWPVIFG